MMKSMMMMLRTLLLCALLVGTTSAFFAETALAVPRMSLTAGTPCSACHLNVTGGGGRTELGWSSMSTTGAITYDKMGLGAVHNMHHNGFGKGTVQLGADVRIQVAKLGQPSVEFDEQGQPSVVSPDRRVIPMQVQPYIGVYAKDWLKLYGTYAAGPSTFSGNFCDPTYAGQSCFAASAQIQPTYTSPIIKVGHFRPAIGIRHDDHTMLGVGDASQPRQPAIAPNYADTGAEMTYSPTFWFQTSVGGFWARNLGEAIADEAILDPNSPAVLGKVMFQPRFEGEKLTVTSWLGSSLYWAGRYRLENYFLGLGLLDKGSLMVEATRSDRGQEADWNTLNIMTMLSVQLREWIILNGRVERATTERAGEEFVTDALVVGAEFFPVPYLELRPEYRILRTDNYSLGQYTIQVHLFF